MALTNPTTRNDIERIRQTIQQLSHLRLGTGSSPSWVTVTLSGLTASRLVWTTATKELASKNLVDLVAGTAKRVTVADDNSGGVVLSGPQDLDTVDSPTFAGATFTAVVTGVTPTLNTHLATKEYVDLAVGTEIDFFFSDTASGVGSNYLMYPIETGGGSSTLNSAALGQGNDQLCFSFLSEAGQPGINFLREGVYSIHAHLNNGTGHKSTAVYVTISYVDSDGSSNETLVATSEATTALTDSVAPYNIHAAVSSDVDINTTKRILIKFFANVGATGTDSTVTITMEGTTDSHVSLSTSSEIYQRQGAVLDDLNTVGAVTDDSYMLVGSAPGVFAWETGATLRTSIGVDAAGTAAAAVATHESTYNHVNYNTAYTHSQVSTGNPHSVTKSEVGLGSVENTALSTWNGSTNITTLGTIATGTWNATTIGISKGGTGATTAQAAIDALTQVAAATNEHVLTKDTATGNAIWKAASSVGAFTDLTDTPANYTGAGGKFVRVNSTPDALEFVTVNDLTADAAPDGDADYVMTYDATASAHKKVLLNNLPLSGDEYVDRGDPAAADWAIGDLTTDGSYHDLDLSSIVPAGATAVVLTGYVQDDAASSAFNLRENGNSNGENLYQARTQVANIPIWYAAIIQMDANRVVEYWATSTTWTQIKITVAGWFVPAGTTNGKVKVDAGATADYIGATSSDGVLRTGTGIGYTDGGNYVTLDLNITYGNDQETGDFNISADETWEDVTNLSITLPEAGTYLILYQARATAQFSVGGPEAIDIRLYNQTDAAAVTATQVRLVTGTSTGVRYENFGTAYTIVTVAGSKEIRMQAYRTAATWTIAQLSGDDSVKRMAYLRIT